MIDSSCKQDVFVTAHSEIYIYVTVVHKCHVSKNKKTPILFIWVVSGMNMWSS